MGKKVEISFRQLSKEALQGAIEAYILRQGHDSGDSKLSLAQKVLQVQWLLDSGKAKIVFDSETKTHSIIKCET